LPPPKEERHVQGFITDVRAGGFEGPVVVGADMHRHVLAGKE
jgi:hypothetical protein